MKFLRFLLLAVILITFCFSYTDTVKGDIMFDKTDTVLIIAPHPDDEALANTAVILDSLGKHAEVYVIFVTTGEHNTDTILKFFPVPVFSSYLLAFKRYKEAVSADKILGIPKDHLIFLGYPDFGMMKILTNPHVNYFSGITLRKHVFEKWSVDRGSNYDFEVVYNEILEEFKNIKPTKVFYPTQYDLNPDHRAVSVLTQAALNEINDSKIETFTYFVHAKGWPTPVGYFPDDSLNLPKFLMYQPQWHVETVTLSQSEISKKFLAVRAHKSQYLSKPKFMLSFVRKNEIFVTNTYSKLSEKLPLFSKEIMRKLEITPFVESASVDSSIDFYNIHFTLFKGVPHFSKINIFLYPEKTGASFLLMPKYRLEVEKGMNNLLEIKMFDKGKVVFSGKESLSGKFKDLDFNVSIAKKYFENADAAFLMISFEQFDLRLTETPWWCINLK